MRSFLLTAFLVVVGALLMRGLWVWHCSEPSAAAVAMADNAMPAPTEYYVVFNFTAKSTVAWGSVGLTFDKPIRTQTDVAQLNAYLRKTGYSNAFAIAWHQMEGK